MWFGSKPQDTQLSPPQSTSRVRNNHPPSSSFLTDSHNNQVQVQDQDQDLEQPRNRQRSRSRSRSPSPIAPPYSPITPTIPLATLANTPPNSIRPPPPLQQPLRDQNSTARPPPLSQVPLPPPPPPPPQVPEPVSMEDNPDAIALRSALSILQIQRQQSLRDLKTLERMKKEAVGDPEEFARGVGDGSVRTAKSGAGGILGLRLGLGLELGGRGEDGGGGGGGDGADGAEGEKTRGFGTIPGPQNVVRMPVVNWDKYHVVGEALERLHREQRARPASTGAGTGEAGVRGEEYTLASPYRPWNDRLEKRDGKGAGGGGSGSVRRES